jgi:hypothetical protein
MLPCRQVDMRADLKTGGYRLADKWSGRQVVKLSGSELLGKKSCRLGPLP